MNSSSNKALLLASIGIGLFFALMYFSYQMKWDFVLLGVFRELLTIPAVLATPVLLFFALRNFKLENYKIPSDAFWASLISLTTLGFLVASFV